MEKMYDPYTTAEIMALEKRIDDLEIEKRELSESLIVLIEVLVEKNLLSQDDAHDLKLGIPKI